jgi:nicotinamidase/pyrazinamidase
LVKKIGSVKNNMKVIFWNVDTQVDFMEKRGKLYVNGAETINENLQKLTVLAHLHNIIVVNTADFHNTKSKEISSSPDFVTTFPEHCIIGSEGAEFISATYPHQFGRESYCIVEYDGRYLDEDLLKKSRNIIIHKDDFDVFEGNHHTEKVLDILKPDLIVVYGVTTNICVYYAVKGLLLRGYKVLVVKDAIKGLPNFSEEGVIKTLNRDGAFFDSTKMVINNIQKLL